MKPLQFSNRGATGFRVQFSTFSEKTLSLKNMQPYLVTRTECSNSLGMALLLFETRLLGIIVVVLIKSCSKGPPSRQGPRWRTT